MKIVFCFITFVFLQACEFNYPSKDPYTLLAVGRDATTREITKAYRKLALKWHPDKNPKTMWKEANAKFKEIAEAYQILSDDASRRTYDREYERRLRQPETFNEPPISFDPYPQPDLDYLGLEMSGDDDPIDPRTTHRRPSTGPDPFHLFDSVFQSGLFTEGIEVVFRDGRYHFYPRSATKQNDQKPESLSSISCSESIDTNQRYSHNPDLLVSSREKVSQIQAMFPEIDSEIIRDVLLSHRGDVQKCCNSLLEIKDSPQKDSSNENKKNQEIWEKLGQLRDMFPEMDEDILYEVILFSKGDMNKAIDSCLTMQREQ